MGTGEQASLSSPSSFLPYFTEGIVVTGFGRGGKQLGCPTANLDDGAVSTLPAHFPCGVFYGVGKVEDAGDRHAGVYDVVLSVGWNPHFKNIKKTIEVHLLHEFDEDFYGRRLRVLILGYLRDMQPFESLEALKTAIQNDISRAKGELAKLDKALLVDKYFSALS